MGRTYVSADILVCFFGMIFGMFALAMMSPSFTAMADGRAAGKAAFETLERKSEINVEDPKSKTIQIEGKIEFKNVEFYYPTKTD